MLRCFVTCHSFHQIIRCCKSLVTSGASELSNLYFSRVSDEKFLSSNGYSIVRTTEPGFTGWLVKDSSGKSLYNAEMAESVCVSETQDPGCN